MRLRLVVLLVLLLAGRAFAQSEDGYEAFPDLIGTGGFILFYDSRGPLSFVSMTRRELPAGASVLDDVEGRACQYGVSIPISLDIRGPSVSGAYGRGGYEDALRAIREEHPDLTGVFDLRVDDRTTSVLGFFRRSCTEVVARGFRF